MCRRAFTLIELLIVIAIVALLIGLALPSLRSAREAGRQVKCQSNMKQFALATITYAMDSKDQVMPALPRTRWPNGTRVWPGEGIPGIPRASIWAQQVQGRQRVPGLLWPYLGNLQNVGECPTNKRQATSGSTSTNVWMSETGVDFDYTFFDETEGTRLGSPTLMGFMPPGTNVTRFQLPAGDSRVLTMFRSIVLFVEESTVFHNDSSRDGMWGNVDQISQRHGGRVTPRNRTSARAGGGNGGGGFLAYLDGSADLFMQPEDTNEFIADQRFDMVAASIYVSGTGSGSDWYALSDFGGRGPSQPANWVMPYGFLNAPRPR